MSLFASLASAANALSVFNNALTVTQNNVSNASTPGFVDQTPTFEANQFDGSGSEAGGVTAGPLHSARNEYAEQAVRASSSQLGYYGQQVQSLSSLNTQFDISGKSGIPAALTSLFGAFSSWANAPNDATARQNVLNQAANVATAFQSTAASVAQTAQSDSVNTTSLVSQINQLAGQLASYNNQISSTGQVDPGTDAAVHNTLEKLSQIASVVTIQEPNGTFNVLLGGQTELVDGATVNKLTAAVYVPTTPSIASGAPVSMPVHIQTGVNDTLNFKVDGASVPPIVLNSADTNPSQVAADINGQFALANVNANASFDTAGRLVVRSTSGTANSSVQLLSGSANTTFGLSVNGPPSVKIVDSYGSDLTAQVTGGSLAAAIEQQNTVLPQVQGDSAQTGSLSIMGKALADRINSVLGMPLFSYDQTNANNVAASLSVNSGLTASQLPGVQVTALTGNAIADPIALMQGVNDTVQLKINGTAQAFTLSPSDTTLASVVSDLNTQFSAAGIQAQANIDAGTGSLQLSATNPTGSIQLTGGTAVATLGLTAPTSTYSANASRIALNLSALANPTNPADQINGQSYAGYFGTIASNVGARLSAAKLDQTTQQDLVTQAQNMRQQLSGVNLNEEATRILQLQSSYQAASKLITVIDHMTESVLNIIS